MLSRLPKAMPTLAEMMHDCGNVKPEELAKALGVNARTVYRWLADGNAPRPAMLALFWVTRWGLQWADAEVHNLASLHMSISSALKDQLKREQQLVRDLQAQVEHLGRLGDFGSANDPAVGVTGPGPVQPMSLTFTGFERVSDVHHQAIKGRVQLAQGIPSFKKKQAARAANAMVRVARA